MKQALIFLVIGCGVICNLQCSKNDNPPLYVSESMDSIFYTESDADFPNPERGFYRYSETYVDGYEPLDEDVMKTWRSLQPADDGNYEIYSTLLFRYIILKGYTKKDLPQSLLDNIQQDFDAIRSAGIKIILRFCYTVETNGGACSEGFVCPPYGDANKENVLSHIAQLKPVLQSNADVIACMQLGFVGIFGENYYSDYFGDPSSNGIGKLVNANWTNKNAVLAALLDALPADRMIQVRTPQMKQRFVYGVDALTNVAALTDAEAFNQTDKARIGFHNDCFLSSPDDYGTFDDFGNSSSPRQPGGTVMRSYMMNDGKYGPVGGETCDDSYSPYNDCESAGKAQTEMQDMHYSFLNSAYNSKVNNDWVSGGCMENIKRNLGYRFVLRNAIYSAKEVEVGKQFSFTLKIENVGYASPYNEHPALIIMKNKASGKEFSFKTEIDVRRWFSGLHTLKQTIITKADMPKGAYELYLHLPDKYESISNRVEYAIRLANDNIWDESTGYNHLRFMINLK